MNKVIGFVLYCHSGKFSIFFLNTSIYDRLILYSNKHNNKYVLFFFNLITWMKSNEVRAMLDKKIIRGGEMSFSPNNLVSNN